MSEPTFWRTELWHPLTIHFPIALLLLATLVKLAVVFMKREKEVFWQKVGSFLLFVGGAGVWVAVFTGDLAEGMVARTICDPIQLKQHEIAAKTMAWLFTSAIALEMLQHLNFSKGILKVLRVVSLLLMLVGSGYLVYTSHLGAQVVYEQAGGVHVPSSDCAGF